MNIKFQFQLQSLIIITETTIHNSKTNMIFVFLSLVALSCAFIYLYVKDVYSYWERRGVKYLQPSFPFGNFKSNFLQKQSFAELHDTLYREAPTEPFIGVYGLFRPILLLRDPSLIQKVLIKDFQHFVNRGTFVSEENDPLMAGLFFINGAKWKEFRVKLSPTFTSGKLKAMFTTLTDCANPLKILLNKSAKDKKVVEFREISACYATNTIASVVFGVDVDCITNPNTSFRRYGRKALELNLKNKIRTLMMFLCPKVMNALKLRVFDEDVADFMVAMVKKTTETREKHNVVRKDFLQLLIQLRNTGSVQLDDDKWETVVANDENKKLTFEEMGAHAFLFYAAGFETSSSTIAFCMYEIAKNQKIQRHVQSEIDSVLRKHNGQLTYDSANEMKYLEACIAG